MLSFNQEECQCKCRVGVVLKIFYTRTSVPAVKKNRHSEEVRNTQCSCIFPSEKDHIYRGLIVEVFQGFMPDSDILKMRSWIVRPKLCNYCCQYFTNKKIASPALLLY